MKYHRFKVFGVEIPNRYIVLALLILGFLAARAYAPIPPHVQVAPEPYPGGPLFTLPVIGEFYWTNTLTATVLADIILLLIAFAVSRAVRAGEGKPEVPKGISGVIEAFIEIIYNLTESTAGKWAKAIFPWFATITLLVLFVNWMELIPGVDSIGFLHEVHEGQEGFQKEQLLPGVYALVKGDVEAEHTEEVGHTEEAGHETEAEHLESDDAHAAGEHGYHIIPYVRVASTSLNFTVSLALIAVIMVQVMGVRSLGPGYFSKFLNLKALWNF